MTRYPFALLFALALLLPAAAKDAPLYKQQDCGQLVAQMVMNQCAGANLDAADAALNAVYQKVMAQQTDQKSKDQLKDLERAWMAYRDKECAFEIGPQEDGGSIWPLDMDNCLQAMTDARIRELKKMAN